jgi:hypothetical protein
MINKLLEKLGIRKKKAWEKYGFSDFFRKATLKEKVEFYSEIMRRSNIRQRKIMEEAEKILAEREKAKTK